mgnify:CR=1 FL=1
MHATLSASLLTASRMPHPSRVPRSQPSLQPTRIHPLTHPPTPAPAPAAGVADHSLTVGDSVLFLSLMAQLYGPLNFFGSYYRTIQQYMVRGGLVEGLGHQSQQAGLD